MSISIYYAYCCQRQVRGVDNNTAQSVCKKISTGDTCQQIQRGVLWNVEVLHNTKL